MIAILSPAKNMKRNGEGILGTGVSKLPFHKETKQLLTHLKELNYWQIESLMKVNEKIAHQAMLDFQEFSFSKKGLPAIYAYDGLVFKQLKTTEYVKEDLVYAENHIRILSGFYGVIAPLDEIHPYRLEMQTPIQINSKNLYQFWNDKLYQELYKNESIIVNLASEEYAKCIRPYVTANQQFIDIEFLIHRDGKLKTIATLAKMARGQMIQYMIQNKVETVEELKEFQWDGYLFRQELSHSTKYVFVKQ